MASNVCLWAEDTDGNWRTTCGEEFVFTDGGPTENGMQYCCYCGKPLQAESYEDVRKQQEPDPIDAYKADAEARGERQ